MKTFSLLLSLPLLVSAHFTLTYPPSRGDNDETQATGPCGGLDTPSSTRTEWPLTGGQLQFEAGHDSANTAVYLAIGNNPSTNDFSITIANVFLQVGLGTFCWNDLPIPNGTAGVRDGVNATIQVVQQGHTSGGLYNCADITLVSDPDTTPSACANASGVTAETATGTDSSSSSSASGSTDATTTNAAAGMEVFGGAVIAGAVAVVGWLL